jgi:hypothetical protein
MYTPNPQVPRFGSEVRRLEAAEHPPFAALSLVGRPAE